MGGALFVVIAVVLVLGIAAAAVVLTSRILAAEHRPTVFAVEEAVAFIGDHLDAESASELTYADVRRVVRWYVDLLDANDLTDLEAYDEGDELIVLDDDQTLGYLLDRAAAAEPSMNPEDVATVHGGLMAYLELIGAVGSRAISPEADPGAPPA